MDKDTEKGIGFLIMIALGLFLGIGPFSTMQCSGSEDENREVQPYNVSFTGRTDTYISKCTAYYSSGSRAGNYEIWEDENGYYAKQTGYNTEYRCTKTYSEYYSHCFWVGTAYLYVKIE